MSLAQIFPFSIWDCPWLALAALAMDLLFGDPPLPWPHPVCGIGRFLNFIEPVCRKFMSTGQTERQRQKRGRLAGLLTLLAAGGGCYFLAAIAVRLPVIGIFLALYLAWAGLAMGCLLRTGRQVLWRIENADIETGRNATSWLVSRETGQLDRPMLRKTLADTLSENFTDAFMAPYFWLVLTGPCGLWFYKASSTMDSQWGYLTPEWRHPGWAGARCDDLLAWLPARISIVMLHCVGHFGKALPGTRPWLGTWPGYQRVAAQARHMPSPNSGWSMTACAWICGARMAGPSMYFGELVHKPWLGPPACVARPWDAALLRDLDRLLLWGTLVGGIIFWLFCEALKLLATA